MGFECLGIGMITNVGFKPADAPSTCIQQLFTACPQNLHLLFPGHSQLFNVPYVCVCVCVCVCVYNYRNKLIKSIFRLSGVVLFVKAGHLITLSDDPVLMSII